MRGYSFFIAVYIIIITFSTNADNAVNAKNRKTYYQKTMNELSLLEIKMASLTRNAVNAKNRKTYYSYLAFFYKTKAKYYNTQSFFDYYFGSKKDHKRSVKIAKKYRRIAKRYRRIAMLAMY